MQIKGKYNLADSLYTLSIEKGEGVDYDAYFNRGAVRLYLKDTIGHCDDIKVLLDRSDKEAINQYKKNCIIHNEEAYKSYKLGLIEYRKENYEQADSLLLLSVNQYPFVENVLLKGINRLKLKDTIGFFEDMKAIFYLHEGAKKNFLNYYKYIARKKQRTLPKNIVRSYSSRVIEENDYTCEIINETGDTIYNAVKYYKHFEAAKADWLMHVTMNMRYPQESNMIGAGGRVYVEFIISPNGKIKYVKTSEADPYLQYEVHRLVSELPPLKPAEFNNKERYFKFNFSITFHSR
jgi:protein TonB